ncbi:MAG: hypothetical protein WCG42_07185 [Parachlamydiaceae bacterium]
MTRSVCVQTSPSGCQRGFCGTRFKPFKAGITLNNSPEAADFLMNKAKEPVSCAFCN